MYISHETGKSGEEIATQYLIKEKYKILERNFKSKQGEIDIIALDKQEIVFVEVKSRTSKAYGNPKDAVDTKKKKHIYNTAQYYTYIHNLEDAPIRFDVIEIYIMNKVYKINHIKQAILERPK